MAAVNGRFSRSRDSVSASTKLRKKRKRASSRATEPASKKRIVSSDDLLNQDAQETARSLTCISKFENLPPELLQQIFFASLNGNLLTASPYIATKLSSQNVYRAAFCIAFHHQDILDLRTRLRLHYLLPEIPVPVPFWELRSMVRAVLDSRWCNIRWVNEHLYCQLDAAMNVFRKDYATRRDHVTSQTMELLSRRKLSLEDLRHRLCLGTGRLGGANELRTDALDIQIVSRSTDSLTTFLDEDEEPWEEMEHFRLTAYAFGDIPISWRFLNENCGRTFRDAVLEGSFLHCGSPRPAHREVFGAIMNQGHIQRALTERSSIGLRQHLQIKYFFKSEQDVYKIDHDVYRVAFESDNQAITEHSAPNTHDQQYLLHILYSIDPYSLPRDSTNMHIRKWVTRAAERMKAFHMKRREARVDLYFLREEEELTDRMLKAARADFRREDLAHKRDREIVHYLATGNVEATLTLGEAMMEPVLWQKNEPVIESELVATEKEATFDDDEEEEEENNDVNDEVGYEELSEDDNILADPSNAILDLTANAPSVAAAADVNGEGAVQGGFDRDIEYEEAEEDTNLYCTCQQLSFGSMIQCDNAHCQYKWFHFECVGVTDEPSLVLLWYCPDCRKAPDNCQEMSAGAVMKGELRELKQGG